MTAPWVDLSQPIYPGMPGAKPHGDVRIWVDEPLVPEHVHLRITHIGMAVHMGTHLDAALHFVPDGKDISQYPTSHFVGAGVALEMPREGLVEIGVADLEEARPSIREGDIVFLHLGYAKRFGASDTHGEGHPYLSEAAAQWLVDRGVRIIGLDVFTPDLPDGHRPDGFDWPVHQILLANDVLVIENLGPGVAQVAGHRIEVVAVPFGIAGADGSPVVPMARIVDGEA